MTVNNSPRLAADVLSEWDYSRNPSVSDPSVLAAYSWKRYWWKCAKGHSYESAAAHRTRGRGCPFCSGQSVLAGFNDFGTLMPHLAHEWSDANPIAVSEVTAWTDYKAHWICPVGHEFQMQVKRRSRGLGCQYCSGYLVLSGFNDLLSQHPIIAAELIGTDPATITSGTHTLRNWKCRIGHQWRTSAKTRVSGSGCPVCSNNKVLPGFNDLASTSPELMCEWNFELNDILPTEVTSGSGKKAHWTCVLGHKWKARIYSRRIRGCPRCALAGTSRIELEMFDRLKFELPLARHRVKVAPSNSPRGFEVDVLAENLVVEYDGSYFHADSTAKDLAKTNDLIADGFWVARIREENCTRLPFLEIEHPHLLQISFRFGGDISHATTQITDWFQKGRL